MNYFWKRKKKLLVSEDEQQLKELYNILKVHGRFMNICHMLALLFLALVFCTSDNALKNVLKRNPYYLLKHSKEKCMPIRFS